MECSSVPVLLFITATPSANKQMCDKWQKAVSRACPCANFMLPWGWAYETSAGRENWASDVCWLNQSVIACRPVTSSSTPASFGSTERLRKGPAPRKLSGAHSGALLRREGGRRGSDGRAGMNRNQLLLWFLRQENVITAWHLALLVLASMLCCLFAATMC